MLLSVSLLETANPGFSIVTAITGPLANRNIITIVEVKNLDITPGPRVRSCGMLPW